MAREKLIILKYLLGYFLGVLEYKHLSDFYIHLLHGATDSVCGLAYKYDILFISIH